MAKIYKIFRMDQTIWRPPPPPPPTQLTFYLPSYDIYFIIYICMYKYIYNYCVVCIVIRILLQTKKRLDITERGIIIYNNPR